MKDQKHTTRTSLLLLVALSSTIARTDVVIQEKVEQRGGRYLSDQLQTTRIKGDKARTDKAYSMPVMTNSINSRPLRPL